MTEKKGFEDSRGQVEKDRGQRAEDRKLNNTVIPAGF